MKISSFSRSYFEHKKRLFLILTGIISGHEFSQVYSDEELQGSVSGGADDAQLFIKINY